MNLDMMREYVLLATNLNFTSTAESLYMEQSTLSRHLVKIEKEIGAVLLIRTTHSCSLTEKGKLVLKEFRRILAIYDQLLESTSSQYGQQINMDVLYYAIDQYAFPILSKFRSLYPQVKVNFLSHQPLDIWEHLLSGDVDIGLSMCSSTKTVQGIKFVPFCREKMALMVAGGNPLSSRNSLKLSELEGETFVFMKDHSWMNDYMQNYFREKHFSMGASCLTEHIDTLSMTLQEKNGVAIVPAHLTNMQRKGIYVIPLQDQNFFIHMCLMFREENHNPNIERMISLAKKIEYGNKR